jgi:NAD(P)-dependent dehydrogenase (short-subunit alcohol dehydrogenase family)
VEFPARPLIERVTDSRQQPKQASEAMHPLGGIGNPEDVVGLASFLLRTDAEWIAGQVIAVDGGLSGVKLPPAAGYHIMSG